VHNTIRGLVVRCRDGLEILRLEAWANPNLSTPLLHVKQLAFDGFHCLERVKICGQNCFRKHVISQNVNQLSLVRWLQEILHCASRKSCKTLIRGSKHREWSRGTERVNEVTSHDCSDQSGQILHGLGQLHNVWDGWHQGRQQDTINNVHDSI